MVNFCGYVPQVLCSWFWLIELLFMHCQCQHTLPLKTVLSTAAYECNGVESFEKVSGVELSTSGRIPLFSSTNGAITADCYNRCRSSSSCSAFWIDYNISECFRLTQPKFIDKKMDIDFTRASAYFERVCLFGDICSKAWVAERIPGYELMGYDDVIIRSVVSRKRCIELCLTEKRLPCRSADFWESRKECRLSREDRRSQPGAFVKSSIEVDYIENACNEPVPADRGKDCEWEVMHGAEFKVYDFTTKSSSMNDCQKSCETYSAFTCRSVTFDAGTGLCLLSGSDTATTSNKLLRLRDKKVYAQRVPCVDMSLECHGESMTAKLKSHAPFYGKIFAVPSTAPECEVFGMGKLLTTITLPLHGCGVQTEANGLYVTTLLVQQHPLIQKRGDSAFRLVCSFSEGNRTLSKLFGYGSDSPRVGAGSGDISTSASGPLPSSITGIGTSIVINSTARSPTVSLRILDSNGDDVTGVSLGDELFLLVEVEEQSAYGVLARDLIAKSGTKEDELMLLDSRGCPEDPSIFPYLKKERSDSKSLKSRFEAFKFTNDAVVRFQVHLQFCRHECPPVKCDGDISFGRRRRDFAETRSDDPDLLELRRDIIVNSPGPADSIRKRSNRVLGGNIQNDDDLHQKKYHEISHVCGSKELVIGVIIAFATMQVLIVLAAVLCVCQKKKDKVINESVTNNGGFTLRSPHCHNNSFTSPVSSINYNPNSLQQSTRMNLRH